MKTKHIIIMSLVLCILSLLLTIKILDLKSQENYRKNILAVDMDEYSTLYENTLNLIDLLVSISDDIIYLNYEAYEEINDFKYTDMDMEYVVDKFSTSEFYPKTQKSLDVLEENIMVLNHAMTLIDNPKASNQLIKNIKELKFLASKLYEMAARPKGSSVQYVDDYYTFKTKYINKKSEIDNSLIKKGEN